MTNIKQKQKQTPVYFSEKETKPGIIKWLI